MLKRRVLKTILIFFVLACLLSTWYINTFLAPSKLKNLLIRQISQAIDRPVFLKSIHFSLIQGFVLKELAIYEPDGKTVFIKIDRLTTTLLFIPLLIDKKIIIPSVYITSPMINIVKNQDNTWNFLNPALFKKTAFPEKPKKRGFSVLVQRIRFDNGQINFSDNTRSPPYAKQLVNLDGDVTISQKGVVSFKALSQLNTPEKTDIALEGSYVLKENLLTIKAALKNISLLEPYNYFYKIGLLTNLKSGASDILLDLTIDKGKKIIIGVNSSVKDLDISYSNLNLKGALNVTGAAELNFGETLQTNYKIDLGLKGSTLSGVYLLNEVSNLSGRIEITNDGISSSGLEGLAYNTPIKFSGGIKNINEPLLRVMIHADLDLANYKAFLVENLKPKFKDIDLEGAAEVNIKFYDRLKGPEPVSIDGNIKLKQATLKSPLIPNKIENCSGGILFSAGGGSALGGGNNLIYLSRLSFNYGTQNYILDAKIKDLELPDVKLKLKNKEFSLDSRFQLNPDALHVLRASGKYLNSSFNIAGDITDLKNPNILMQGSLVLNLSDLRKTFPKMGETLTRFDVQGICNLELYLNGLLKDPTSLEAIVKGQSDRISIWNFKFDEVKLDLRMKEKGFLIPEFSAKPYGGTFFSTLEMDLSQPNPPYIITLNLEGVDLSKLVLDTDLKNKPTSGKAQAKFNIHGYGKNLETTKGDGSVLIKGGYLWEVPLLRGLADLLFLPNLSSIVFDEASATFVIANKSISTADLKFNSRSIGLLGEGGVNFNGNIDLLITTSISEDFIKGTSEFARLASTLLAEAGQFIGSIKITGTIKKPEYKFIPLPINKILKNKLKGLLGGFF